MSDEITRLKLLKLAALEEQEKLRINLPHLHFYKFYPWSRKFFESRAKIKVLTAANQIGKSSSQMRNDIHWATEPKLWPELWPTLRKGQVPGQFWYLYPTKDVATVEFEEKWRQFLPGGDYKNHPQYGWEDEWDNKKISALHFNTGVTIYFKTYAMDLQKLQSGSVFKLSCDEELDAYLFDELSLRVAATDGYMSFVFTATKGQEFWRKIVEDKTLLTEAEVYQISMFDCLEYEDGTPSPWTRDRIEKIISRCRSEAEVQRRVFGKFAVDEGRKYESFERKRNVVKPYDIPRDWIRYAGIDIGGGGSGHPAAICFIAVRPDFQKGAVYKFWRGDGQVTTAQDILQKYLELKGGEVIAGCTYDWAAKDFATIAARSGVSVKKAEKSHEIGEGILNSLFKYQMLDIFDGGEQDKLTQEFLSLLVTTAKQKARDDGIDSCFVAGTLVETSSGLTPIEEVRAGDRVLTRSGLKRVLDAGETNSTAKVMTLGFANGAELVCTPNHRIFTQRGWLMARDMQIGDLVLASPSCQNQKPKQPDSMELSTGDIQTQSTKPIETTSRLTSATNKEAPPYSTEIFGYQSTAPSLMAFTFITKTETRSTIGSRILSLFRPKSTRPTTLPKTTPTPNLPTDKLGILRKLGHSLRSGTALRRDSTGTENTLGACSAQRTENRFLTPAITALKNIWRMLCVLPVAALAFAQIIASRRGVANQESITRQDGVPPAEALFPSISTRKPDVALVSVRREPGTHRVYNLTVEDEPEYFAGGILVHNCRYNAAQIPWDFGSVTVSHEPVIKKKDRPREAERKDFMVNFLEQDGIDEELQFWDQMMNL